MLFTGINYRSLPLAKSFSADFNFVDLINSGDKYNANIPSGIHFGFSGSSDNVSFLMRQSVVYRISPQILLFFF